MFKAAGSIVLLASAFFYSINRLKAEKNKIMVLTELYDLLSYIYKNIECFSKPFGELCREYTSPILAQYGFYTLWHAGKLTDAVLTISGSIDSVTKRELQKYAELAGLGYKDEELRLCRYTMDFLKESIEKEKQEQKPRTRMFQTLPYILALSIVLLLY